MQEAFFSSNTEGRLDGFWMFNAPFKFVFPACQVDSTVLIVHVDKILVNYEPQSL